MEWTFYLNNSAFLHVCKILIIFFQVLILLYFLYSLLTPVWLCKTLSVFHIFNCFSKTWENLFVSLCCILGEFLNVIINSTNFPLEEDHSRVYLIYKAVKFYLKFYFYSIFNDFLFLIFKIHSFSYLPVFISCQPVFFITFGS